MHVRKSAIVTLILCLILSLAAFAQSNELAVTAGAQFPNNSHFNSGTSWAVGASFAHRIFHVPLAGLYWEIPVVGAPNSVMKVPFRTTYSSLFVTPGLKVKFAPGFFISPWLVAGIGIAHFHNSANAAFPDSTSTTAAFDIGGGFDLKLAPYIGIRGELRDFYSGLPSIAAASGLSGRQHNVVPQAGLVIRF
jgi:hypothetical protein